ncbi:MAG TPA: hypothetical protein VL201_02535 [Patescibacteria group bacterium]|jgi:hypothetical protein|nr:hypothetical protein [Patescibacteria group bacterium]
MLRNLHLKVNKMFNLLIFLQVISISYLSHAGEYDNCYITYLKAFPDKINYFRSAYPYRAMTEEDIKKSVYLPEGCYTVLKNDTHTSALVGPLAPCQCLVLDFNKEYTVVAHINFQSDFSSLLHIIKHTFSECDSSKITAELFTTHSSSYEYSWQKDYQNRTQADELKHNKEKIIKILSITEDQIVTRISSNDNIRNAPHPYLQAFYEYPEEELFSLGNYSLAELFFLVTTIKNDQNTEYAIFNTCPMAEKYFGNFQNLSLQKHIKQIDAIIKEEALKFFFKQLPQDQPAPYGSFPFIYIPYANN